MSRLQEIINQYKKICGYCDRFWKRDALDIDMITDNPARLNAAFCMLLGDLKKTKERVALRDLANGGIGRSWFNLKNV